jgi:hypothetical protein
MLHSKHDTPQGRQSRKFKAKQLRGLNLKKATRKTRTQSAMKKKVGRTPDRRRSGWLVSSCDKGPKLMAFINSASTNISLVSSLSAMQTTTLYFVIMENKLNECFGIFSHTSMAQMIFIYQCTQMCYNLVLLQISWVKLKFSLVSNQLLSRGRGDIHILYFCHF